MLPIIEPETREAIRAFNELRHRLDRLPKLWVQFQSEFNSLGGNWAISAWGARTNASAQTASDNVVSAPLGDCWSPSRVP